MKPQLRRIAIVAVVVVAPVVVAWGLLAWAVWAVMRETEGPPCDAREERLEPTLRDLPILRMHPSDTKLRDHESYCGSDSGDPPVVGAFTTYRFTGDPIDIVQFYRTAAVRAGWTIGHDSGGSRPPHYRAERLCFDNTIDGASAQLTLYFNLDYESDTLPESEYPRDEYHLDVSASYREPFTCEG